MEGRLHHSSHVHIINIHHGWGALSISSNTRTYILPYTSIPSLSSGVPSCPSSAKDKASRATSGATSPKQTCQGLWSTRWLPEQLNGLFRPWRWSTLHHWYGYRDECGELEFCLHGSYCPWFWPIWARTLCPYKVVQGLSCCRNSCQFQAPRGSGSRTASGSQEGPREAQSRPGILPKTWPQLLVLSLYVWRNVTTSDSSLSSTWYSGGSFPCPSSLWSIQEQMPPYSNGWFKCGPVLFSPWFKDPPSGRLLGSQWNGRCVTTLPF